MEKPWGEGQFGRLIVNNCSTKRAINRVINFILLLKRNTPHIILLIFTPPRGSRVQDSTPVFFLFFILSLSRLICKPQSHVFWAWLRVNAICIDGKAVTTSDSESVGPSEKL